MTVTIAEFFGYAPDDLSPAARQAREEMACPFIGDACTKHHSDGAPAGACTLRPSRGPLVVCCPNRLYAEDYLILNQVAEAAFGSGLTLVAGQDVRPATVADRTVAVFGKRWGKELRLPKRGGRGAYFVDWILALIGSNGSLAEFVAVEVQTIDTTGSYRAERDAYLRGERFSGSSTANFNWENVSKRILPQIIYKGHVLRRESLCRRGLFFVTPTPVYQRVRDRLSGQLLEYGYQPGSLTFQWYDLGPSRGHGATRRLELGGQLVTTTDQVANAFVSPSDLPPAGVYEDAIRRELGRAPF